MHFCLGRGGYILLFLPYFALINHTPYRILTNVYRLFPLFTGIKITTRVVPFKLAILIVCVLGVGGGGGWGGGGGCPS